MAAVGFLVFRLIDDSQQGKADARVNGIASAAASVYEQASRSASYDARPSPALWTASTGRPWSGGRQRSPPRSGSSA